MLDTKKVKTKRSKSQKAIAASTTFLEEEENAPTVVVAINPTTTTTTTNNKARKHTNSSNGKVNGNGNGQALNFPNGVIPRSVLHSRSMSPSEYIVAVDYLKTKCFPDQDVWIPEKLEFELSQTADFVSIIIVAAPIAKEDPAINAFATYANNALFANARSNPGFHTVGIMLGNTNLVQVNVYSTRTKRHAEFLDFMLSYKPMGEILGRNFARFGFQLTLNGLYLRDPIITPEAIADYREQRRLWQKRMGWLCFLEWDQIPTPTNDDESSDDESSRKVANINAYNEFKAEWMKKQEQWKAIRIHPQFFVTQDLSKILEFFELPLLSTTTANGKVVKRSLKSISAIAEYFQQSSQIVLEPWKIVDARMRKGWLNLNLKKPEEKNVQYNYTRDIVNVLRNGGEDNEYVKVDYFFENLDFFDCVDQYNKFCLQYRKQVKIQNKFNRQVVRRAMDGYDQPISENKFRRLMRIFRSRYPDQKLLHMSDAEVEKCIRQIYDLEI